MKANLSITLSLLFLAICGGGYGQNLSNRGTDFWVGYGHHQFMEPGQPNSQEMILYLSAEQAANVTVAIEGTSWIKNYSVPANTVIASDLIPKGAGGVDARLISLPCSFVPPGTPCGGVGTFCNKGIHITSNVPIVAYAHIYGSTSSGASMLMPVETWGYSYTTLNSTQEYAANCFSWLYAIAQHDNTVIEVTPSVTTRDGRPAGVPFTVTLNRGCIYQTMAGPEAASAKAQMSGSTIKSIANSAGQCYPIAVFAGSSRTRNPFACGSSGGDNDNQQCFPSQAWGKRYLTAPTSNSTTPSTLMTNAYRIAVKDPTTVVKRNGTTLTPLANGTYYYESGTADYIEADKPIMVAQFMTGSAACMGGGGVGDPEMMYISPLEQGIKRIGFYRNNVEAITVNYLTLIIPTAGVASLTIDGSSTFSHTYPHPNLPGYTVVVRRWTSAKAQATAQSDSAFTAITYGLGSVESYGYNAGTLINNLNAIGSLLNVADTSSATSHPYTCVNTPVKLSVLLGYPSPPTKLVWQLSQVGGGLSPNADVTDNTPTPVGTQTFKGVPYYKYELPGTYTFTTPGIYKIPILATHPSIEKCDQTEEVFYEMEVKANPAANFTVQNTGCVLDTVKFFGETTTSNGFTLNQWLYTFPDATTSISKDTSKKFLAAGTYPVMLKVVSTEGCVGDTTIDVSVSAAPVTDFTTVPAAVCKDASVTFNDASTYTGAGNINNSWWDFGDGTKLSATNANPVTHTYTTAGVFTVRHTAGLGASCLGDTITKTVTVYAPPTTSFTFPSGCLPASGIVQFNSTASTADGQAITGHLWTFGDPASGAANTSTLANPTHTYPGFGTYTITYQATSANGCVKDTTVTATMNLAPTFSYPALAAVCANATGTVNVATATVTNSVPGTGEYHGPATSPAGLFTPSQAGAGTYTIWYVYTTTANCKDSVSQTITVKPTPDASFSIPAAGCLPPSGAVSFSYSGTAITGQTYLWDFGDPASGAGNTSTLANPTHNYGTGTYTIKLTVTANGCSKDSIVTQPFDVTPALVYGALAAVCQNAPPVSVANGSVTNGATGTGTYRGPGTSTAGMFDPAVAGAGTHTIWYVFATAGGCRDSVSRTITVNPTPDASFSIPAAGCLPANGQVNFSYTGTAQAGQTYLWNFGDPASGTANTSTLANPTHNFTTGTYTIKLTVTSTNGCVKDSIVTQAFTITPALSYPALTAVCANAGAPVNVATATVTNGATGTGVYSGPGTSAAGVFDPAIAGAGTHTITYTFTGSGNCVSTITQTITVYATPDASFSIPAAGCLPANGLVSFTYTGTALPGQTYLWNFGDPASGAANTSTVANPSHNFVAGSYIISLKITSANGCVKDSVITQQFNVTPALAWTALAPVCQNAAAPVNIATATVTNGATGTGIYKGPGTSAAGLFDAAAAGAGTHTIWYVFTAGGNCKDSVSRTIVVYPTPDASLSIPAAGCLPANGLVSFTYTGTALPGQTYLWNFGDPASGAANTSTVASPSHNFVAGSYTISLKITSANGCVKDSVITQQFNVTPALAWTALAPVCQNAAAPVNIATATVTNGATGTGIYKGPGTSAAGLFDAAAAGAGTHTIWYVFTAGGNCKDSVSRTIVVYPTPDASFSIPAAGCLPANGQVNLSYTGTALPGQTYLWNFGDPASGAANTSTLANPSHNFTTGSYTISLQVSSSNGCVKDSTITQAFNITPALNYPALSPVCESVTGTVSLATATVTNGATGTGVYSGPGMSANGDFSPSAAGAGTHTITYTFTGSGNCVSTVTQTILVYAKPNASFTYPTAACLPVSGLAQFTYNGSAGAGNTYLWDFGDPASGTSNSSSAQSPSHNYTNTGNYNVKLSVTNANGCVDDTIININFSVTPALSFPALTALCESVPGTVNIALATVTNGVTGTGVYSGPGTSANGSFSPAAAGPGTHTITYTFTSTGNCVSSITQSITVYPKPVSQFTASGNVCLGQATTFTDNSTITTGTISSWEWIFGDGTTATYSNGSPFTHTYTAYGTYNVKLVTTGSNGCVSDTATQTITISPVPVASFTPPTSVCMPNGNSSFVNNSNDGTGAGGLGSLSYSWDFGDGSAPSTAVNGNHVYGSISSYPVTLTATSAAGCVDDTTIVFSAFFDKPFAFFTVSPDSLCQGADNVFTDGSTAPNSSIANRLWIFGDGTTSTNANPTKRYSSPGLYTVKLVVGNTQGCVSDTFSRTVRVYVQPVVDAGPSFVVPQGTLVLFNPSTNDSTSVTFQWSPSIGLSNPTILRPTVTATTDQTYTLTATGAGNCTASDVLTVRILRPITVPNAFSPNGDGTNDTWIIENLSDYPGAVVEVYNRYGQLLYMSNGYSTPWDGTTKGRPLPVATYYYIIQLKNGYKPLNGSVTIIR